GIGVDRIGDLGHVTLLHQDAHHVDRSLGHAVGQFLDRDRLGDRHLAGDLFLGLAVAVTADTLDAAAKRCNRAFTHFVGGKGGHDGQPAAALFTAATWRLGRRRRPRGCAAAGATRGLLLVGFKGRAGATRLCRCRIRAEALLGDLVGLAPGFFVVFAAFFLIKFACFRRGALGALGIFTAAANAGLFRGDLTFFLLAQTRVGKRVSARAALFLC